MEISALKCFTLACFKYWYTGFCISSTCFFLNFPIYKNMSIVTRFSGLKFGNNLDLSIFLHQVSNQLVNAVVLKTVCKSNKPNKHWISPAEDDLGHISSSFSLSSFNLLQQGKHPKKRSWECKKLCGGALYRFGLVLKDS